MLSILDSILSDTISINGAVYSWMFRRPATSLGQSRRARSDPCHSLKWCSCQQVRWWKGTATHPHRAAAYRWGPLSIVHDMQCRGLKGSKRKIGQRLADHLLVLFPFTFIYIHLHSFTFIYIHLHSFAFIYIIYNVQRVNKINLSVMELLIHCDPSPQWNSSVPTHKGNNCMAPGLGPKPHMEPGSGTSRKGATMGVFGPALESNSCGNHGDLWRHRAETCTSRHDFEHLWTIKPDSVIQCHTMSASES